MKSESFFAELKRRHVYKIGAAYVVAGWIIVQVVTQVFPVFNVSAAAQQIILLLIIAGFPVTLVLSWLFDITPHGIVLTDQLPASGETTVVRHKGRSVDRKLNYVLGVLLLCAVSYAIVDHVLLRRAANRGNDTRTAIAVLPLVNTGSDPNNEYFSDGLTEELIAVLAKVPALKLIGRSSSFLFKGTSDDSRTIGRKLGVTNLLEGSVRKQGDRVRIVAELINAADGRELWTETYDRELKDVFAVQSEIATAVTAQLKIKLLGPPLQSDAEPSNESLAAYTALQQGNFYLSRSNQEGFRKAVEFYNEAIRLDPTYALGYANLSIALQFLGQTGGISDAEDAKARSAAQTALSLPPNISQAHAAMGGILLYDDNNFDAAAVQYRQAVELAPTAVLPKARLTYLLFTQGHLEEAEAMARETLTLDPLDALPYINLGRILIARERYDEAESVLRKAIELKPKASRWHMHLTHIYLLKGKPAAALEEARLEPAGFFQDYAIALAQQAQGDRANADDALQKFFENDGAQGPFQVASIYAMRKEPEQMFAWLQRCYDQHDVALTQLLSAPFIHNYRNDPRFAALCQKLKLPVPQPADGK